MATLNEIISKCVFPFISDRGLYLIKLYTVLQLGVTCRMLGLMDHHYRTTSFMTDAGLALPILVFITISPVRRLQLQASSVSQLPILSV